jgi:hypothetical protein
MAVQELSSSEIITKYDPINVVNLRGARTELYIGIGMIYAAIFLLIFVVFRYHDFIIPIEDMATGKDGNLYGLVAVASLPIGLILFCVATFFLGYRLIAAAGATADVVLPGTRQRIALRTNKRRK